MERQKALEKLLTCVLCHERFKKENKPLIMFCGHNICEECKIKNLKKVTCSICKKVFSKREIKKFQINYSILENKNISQAEESKHKENSEKNEITSKNVLEAIYSKFIFENVGEAKEEDKKEEKEKNKPKKEIDEIIKERELIVNDTNNYIDNLEKNYYEYLSKFYNFIIKDLYANKEILINDLKIPQLLEETGVINFGDMIKLQKFMEIFEGITPQDLVNCSSFEQIYSLISEKNEFINYEEFISLFFFFNKTFEMKIKKMQKIFESQKKIYSNDKECKKNLIHFIFNFVLKFESNLSDMFYDVTTYKSCHFIFDINKNEKIKNSLNEFYKLNHQSFEEYNNILIIYEPIEQKLNTYIIKIKELKEEKIIDSYLFLTHALFILTNKKLYIYKIKEEKYSSINFFQNQEIEENSKIIKYDIYLMIISSNSFQSINLREDMTKNDWRSISLFENKPGTIKKPYPICHGSNYIYILDKEKNNINEVYMFNPEVDSWDKKEIKLEMDSKNEEKNKNNVKIIYHNKKDEEEETIIVKQLLLEDYYLFNKCYTCIWGGRHPITKKFNKNVYKIDLVKGIMKKIISFDEYITDNMVVIDLNIGILCKHVDFIIVYHLVKEENNIKIKVIRKEIIENDISLYTKLKVLMDVNLSEISSHN